MRTFGHGCALKVSGLGVLLSLVIILPPLGRAGLRKGEMGVTASILSGFPSGNFADLTNSGLGLGLELEYYVSNSVAVGLLFNYLPFQGPDIVDTITLSEEWTIVSYGIIGKYHFDPQKELVPYVKAGGLVSFYDVNISRQVGPAIDTSFSEQGKLTAMGGLGLRWDIEDWVGVSGELLFSKIFDVVHDLRGRRVNVDAQYVSFNLNATLFLGRNKED